MSDKGIFRPFCTPSSFPRQKLLSIIGWKKWNTGPPFNSSYASVNRVSIDSDNGLSPIRRQVIIWTNAGLLSFGSLGTNCSEIVIKIRNFSFMKMHLKISSAKWRPFCPGGDVLTKTSLSRHQHKTRAWIGDYNFTKEWDVITDQCPNFNVGLKPPLYLGQGLVFSFSIEQI